MSDAFHPEDMDLDENEDVDFALISFKHRGRKRKIEEIDLVRTDWLRIHEKNLLQCKFLDSMEEAEDVKLLHDLVEMGGPAPSDWPSYPVRVIGRARTHEEGLAKLERLKTSEDAFTTDSEEGEISKAEQALIRQVKRAQLKAEAENVMKKFKKSTGTAESNSSAGLNKAYTKKMVSPKKTKKHVLKRIENGQGSNRTELTIQSNSHSDSSSGIDLDANGSLSANNDDENATDKENAPEMSTGEMATVTGADLPILDLSHKACSNEFETGVVCFLTKLDERTGTLEKDVANVIKGQRELKTLLNELIVYLKKI
ncbi:hypothetical protein QAD02_002497 [Eretmocerus hayati]|uniref:Uncharacterized protein n=1 Tax=Eretmocerus hayati TaxID=131215 RepID=A0ACC2NK94_9HYME|nr:hypothetical protein QAD02_002497 [Eretmocerus hayati]